MTITPVQDDAKNKTKQSTENKNPRLPCRGCLALCSNYDRCDGKLWRMSE